MRSILSLLIALVVVTPIVAGQSAAISDQHPGYSAGTAQDTVDVQHVMDAFHEAVLSHNGPRLEALFLSDGNSWITALSDNAYAIVKAKSPNTSKVHVGSYKDFVKFVSTSKVSLDPQHSHIQIHSDGTIAVIYFDFKFFINGKDQNDGSETWQLVKGSDGWRIAAILYSSTPSNA